MNDGSWRAVIGLEVHARLQTATKAFCGCPVEFGAPPNTNVCPVCLGYPGALPHLNREAVALALTVAVATGCEVALDSRFARKNYFYPDLPKGYQISQYDRPLATGGGIPIRTAGGEKLVRVQRIHIEEDAGKLLHASERNESLVDLNRAGAPLIEIVTEPDLASPEEAVSWLMRLRQILITTGASDGNMEEGSLRCDANVSVHRKGEPLGTRTEVKNLNSFRFLGRAIEYEIGRQVDVVESGGRVALETRSFDAVAGVTRTMRSKEEAHDYRYFPEPDLLALRLDAGEVAKAREALPELPHHRVARYERDLAMPWQDAEALVADAALADYFDRAVTAYGNVRAVTNWIKNELVALLRERETDIAAIPLAPERLARLVDLVERGVVGGRSAKEVFEEIVFSGESPDAVVERRGLSQISDEATLREIAARVVANNPGQVAQYRSGRERLFGFFVGEVMKETGGRANAAMVNAILHELLDV